MENYQIPSPEETRLWSLRRLHETLAERMIDAIALREEIDCLRQEIRKLQATR